MSQGFWEKLKSPFFVLAPMADVTDAAFRRIIAKYGKPDVMFTEFVSTDGLCSEGKENLLHHLWYTEQERPIVAQVFGATPEHFYKAALFLQELGFDGIDINMGCPDRTLVRSGSCAALIENPQLAQDIIKATKKGAGTLPVSVKTRIGLNTVVVEKWISHLLETEPAAITVHGRTKKEMSKVPVHWDAIAKAVEVRNRAHARTRIIGNGDVMSLVDAEEKVKEYGVDGVMLGRAIFGNPWIFNRKRDLLSMTQEERLKVLVEHTFLYERLFAGKKKFHIMKKHFKAYVSSFKGARELRIRLMEVESAKEVEQILQEYLKQWRSPVS